MSMVQTAAAWIHRSVDPPEPFSLNKLLSRGDVAHRLEEIGPPLDNHSNLKLEYAAHFIINSCGDCFPSPVSLRGSAR